MTVRAAYLLADASETGIAIHARADIDPAGFVIVATIRPAAPNTRLWRFDTPTYATHLGIEVAEGVALADAHEQYGTDLHEEAILVLLLDDLLSFRSRLSGRRFIDWRRRVSHLAIMIAWNEPGRQGQ